MVPVGRDLRGFELGRRGDSDAVFRGCNGGADFSQFGCHCGHTIGFFDPPVVDISNACGAFCKQRSVAASLRHPECG